MKFNININQEKLIKLAPDANLNDGAILDYVYYFCSSPSEEIDKMRIVGPDGKKYTWVNYDWILKEMPLLRGKTKGTLTPVFKRLEEWNFIKSYSPDNQKKYITLLPKIDELFRKLNGFNGEAVLISKQSCLVNSTNHITIDHNTKLYNKISFLKEMPELKIKEIADKYKISVSCVKNRIEDVIDYCEAKGKKYSNYEAALRNFIKSHIRKYPDEIIVPVWKPKEFKLSKEDIERRSQILKGMSMPKVNEEY